MSARPVVTDLNELVAVGARFGTIYADPPWRYDNAASRGAAAGHYETLTVDQIAALPVPALVADDAHLHLWTTNAFLRQSFDIIRAWGFEFRDVMIWAKPELGLGNYWRNSHEILLLGIRGRDDGFRKDISSVLVCRRSRHSAKPDHVRNIIERVSPAPRLELFGRRAVSGWTVFGNEVEADLFGGWGCHRDRNASHVGGTT